MSGARVDFRDGVRVVHLDGCATDDDVGASIESLGTDDTGPTILDLADLTLIGTGIDLLVDRLVSTCDAVCVIARRRTARTILHRSGVGARCAIFGSVGDALQSLHMAERGYGAGWRQMSGARR